MDLKQLLKFGLLGFAGFMAYRQFADSSASSSVPPASGGASNTGAPPPADDSNQTSAAWLQTFKATTVAAAGSPTLTPDEWDWYFEQATGEALEPAPEAYGFTGDERNKPVTFETWWSRLTHAFPEVA